MGERTPGMIEMTAKQKRVKKMHDCGLTHEQIADALGKCRPAITRIIGRMRQRGHIATPEKPRPVTAMSLTDWAYPLGA